jgi:hypothetical protein
MKSMKTLSVAGALTALPTFALAQDAAPSFDEIGPYLMTTLLFLVGGFLVFWMAAGFAMLEAGLVRSKNVAMQLTKNIALFSIAGIMYWAIGFNLMYPGDFNGYIGSFFVVTELEPVGLAAADASLDYASVASDFFFQLMFVAATASIVSGALAERIKLWPFLLFAAILTGVMYPVPGSGAAASFLRWVLATLQARPLYTPLVAGLRWLVRSCWARVWASTKKAAPCRCRVPTLRWRLWVRSSCGSVGSALTVGRSWLRAQLATSQTWAASLPTPTWPRPLVPSLR